MNRTQSWQVSFLMLCFMGPLVLVLWPAYSDLDPVRKSLIREGTGYFIVTTLLFFILRILAEIPLIGLLFQIILIMYWMLYVAGCIWIIIKKNEDPSFHLPFISTHAERMEVR